MKNHIVESYDDNLNRAKSLIARMFGLVEQALLSANQAVKERDTALANLVIEQDKIVDDLAFEAEEMAVDILIRRSPVANDLRATLAILKISSMIERVGDYAKNIAKRVKTTADSGYFQTPTSVTTMMAEASKTLSAISAIYIEDSVEKAVTLWKHDKYLDDMHNAAYRDIVEMMVADSHLTATLTHFLMIVKSLERIGDQAANIADMIYYVENGHYIDQPRPKRDHTAQLLI